MTKTHVRIFLNSKKKKSSTNFQAHHFHPLMTAVKAIRRLVDAFEMKNYKLTMTLVHTQGNSKSIVSGTMFHRDENVSFQLHNIYPPQKYGLSARHIINGNAYYAISGTCSRWNRDYETQLYKAIEINTMYAILNRKDIVSHFQNASDFNQLFANCVY